MTIPIQTGSVSSSPPPNPPNPLADILGVIEAARVSREKLAAALTQAKALRDECNATIEAIEAEIAGKRKPGRPKGGKRKKETKEETS